AGCSVLIGAFGYTPPATAHIGNSHAPGTTDGPDVRTATITSGETARVCFDEEVGTINFNGFNAVGYDSNIGSDATDADIDITNTSCVLVDTDHPNLTEATVLVVDDNAVEDVPGNDNAEGAVTLTGSTFNVREAPRPGNTDAPEHISTTPIPQDDDIEYGMDEELDEDADIQGTTGECDEGSLGYHEQSGDLVFPDDCTTDGSTIIASFGTDIQSNNVIRPFVRTEAEDCGENDDVVRDLGTDELGGDTNEESKYATQSGGTGDNTNDVDLLSIARQGNNQLIYTFDSDAPLTGDASEDCFFAYSEDGSVYVGDSSTRTGQVVTVTFDNVANAFQQIILASVATDAVFATGGDTNTYGSSPLSASGTETAASEIPASQAPGYSDGPDLEQAVTNGTNNTINYCHDEPLDPSTVDHDSDDYRFTTSDSEDESGGDDVLSVSGACVLIQFDGTDDVETAVYAYEDANDRAGRDRLGECDNDNEKGNQGAFEDCDDPDPGSDGRIDDDGNNRNLAGAGVAVNGPPPSSLAAPPAPPGPGGPPGPPGAAGCPPPYDVKKGTSGDDKLRGTPDCDKLKGKGGDDVLKGRGEDDKLIGGPGDDVLKGGPGDDICKGGPGKDTKISC
ncbi:MAG: calcium-binding protein, partial [Nocardioidaceae bacterium]